MYVYRPRPPAESIIQRVILVFFEVCCVKGPYTISQLSFNKYSSKQTLGISGYGGDGLSSNAHVGL